MDHAKKKNHRMYAVYYAIVAAVCVAAIIYVNSMFRSDSANGADNYAAEISDVSDSTAAETSDADTSDAETEPPATSEFEQIATEPAVTEPAVIEPPVNEPPVTEPPVTSPPIPYVTGTEYVPPAVRDTDFSGSLFIGDSRTEGFMLYSGVTGAAAYTARGAMVDTFFTSPVVNLNGRMVTMAEALAADPNYSSVYVMFGINELGWVYESVFRDSYARLINYIRDTVPGAEIYVQSIIPVTLTKSCDGDIFTNERITVFNNVIINMCADLGVNFVDLRPALCAENGALPEDAAFDGIHLKQPYCRRWLDYLVENRSRQG